MLSPITNPFGIHRITQSHRHYSYSVGYDTMMAIRVAHYSVIQCVPGAARRELIVHVWAEYDKQAGGCGGACR